MKLKLFLAVVTLHLMGCLYAQQTSPVLLTIEDKIITVDEFLAVYQKNNLEVEVSDKKSVDDYLDMYINFKLKVYEAEKQGLDTVPKFTEELEGYIEQLAKPYLVDNQFTEDLIKEAYQRLKWEVNAQHIMVKLPANPSPQDTVEAWKKINELYGIALSDSIPFEDLAIRYSDDPSAVKNGGNLGYFTAFRMVYPFESAAYTTPVGHISKPVRTAFGYHIIKVIDKRPARGEIRASHIMVISNEKTSEEDKEKAKRKIFEIYKKLQDGEDFTELAKTYSDDRGSAQRGGDLGWFGAGRMVPEFEEKAFGLQHNGDYSEPFLTQFGWHIVKRTDKRDLGSYEAEYERISDKVQQDSRSQGSQHALVEKLINEYKVKVKIKEVEPFFTLVDSSYFTGKWNDSVAIQLTKPLLIINDKKYGKKKVIYTQADFARYIAAKMGRKKARSIEMFINDEFDAFIDAKIIAYEKSILKEKYPKYRALVSEYHDGMLLFEIMEKEVWKKAVLDTIGLEEFFKAHQNDYMWKERMDVVMYICKDKETGEGVIQMIEEGQTDSAILARFNVNSELVVHIRKGKFEQGQEPDLENVPFKKGISLNMKGNKTLVINVLDIIPTGPKTLDEVRGLVTSAYQDELDALWVKELRAKYTFSVNQEELSKISK